MAQALFTGPQTLAPIAARVALRGGLVAVAVALVPWLCAAQGQLGGEHTPQPAPVYNGRDVEWDDWASLRPAPLDPAFRAATRFDPRTLTYSPPTAWWCPHAPEWSPEPVSAPTLPAASLLFLLLGLAALPAAAIEELVRRAPSTWARDLGATTLAAVVALSAAQVVLGQAGLAPFLASGPGSLEVVDAAYLRAAPAASVVADLVTFGLLAAVVVGPLTACCLGRLRGLSLLRQLGLGALAGGVAALASPAGAELPVVLAFGAVTAAVGVTCPLVAWAVERARLPRAAGRWARRVAASAVVAGLAGAAWAAWAACSRERELVELGPAFDPIPSPDGSRLAYVRTPSDERHAPEVVEVATREGQRLPGWTPVDGHLMGWTPDGQALVVLMPDRRFAAVIRLDGVRLREGRVDPPITPRFCEAPELTYLPHLDRLAWVQGGPGFVAVFLQDRELARAPDGLRPGQRLVPSPDGRHVALFDPTWDHGPLSVLDVASGRFADLGRCPPTPEEWENSGDTSGRFRFGLTWDPWFRDGTRLVVVREGAVCVVTPDGASSTVVCRPSEAVGLPSASPDGRSIAFVTYRAGVRPEGFDVARLWTVAVAPGATPRPVTGWVSGTVRSLRWVDDRRLVFDRLPEGCACGRHGTLWTARLP